MPLFALIVINNSHDMVAAQFLHCSNNMDKDVPCRPKLPYGASLPQSSTVSDNGPLTRDTALESHIIVNY